MYAKVFGAIVVGYALSPLDLIPDFISVLGYLDDVILLPLGIMFILKLIPSDVMNECREMVMNNLRAIKPKVWVAAYAIVVVWIALFYNIYCWVRPAIQPSETGLRLV